ncbi:epidermal differentiation-specific protein-like [Salminus brasiliensis]|uniref:epidermal differentiation-specific protein-like n=1 Tax=Salminus brasiliensis TaxID=930266 RepID=UPI003B83199D
MSKIILYEHYNFQGLSREFTSDVANLISHNFNDCISSLKVVGNPWVVYRDVNFAVPLAVYEEGEYAQVQNNDTFSSLQLVTEDLTNPQITLYEHANYQGRSVVINAETSLSTLSFNGVISSHRVQRGVWVLYEQANQTGRIMVARAGQDVTFYESFNDCLSYLRPLKPGGAIVKAVLLWDNKVESTNSVTTNAVCSLNSSDQVKPFCPNLGRMYDVFVSESFSFSRAAGIGMGTKFDLDLSGLRREFAVKDTFTVEKGTNNTRVEKKTAEVFLPATVPPHTKITVNLVTKEVDIKVPVRLIYGLTEVICGEYVCHSELSLSTEYKQQAI